METLSKFEEYIKTLRPEKSHKELISAELQKIKALISQDEKLATAEFEFAGPFRRETMINGNFEAELLFVLNRKILPFKEIIFRTENLLKTEYPTISKYGQNKFTIRHHFLKENFIVKIDIMPSFKVNSPKQLKEVKRPDYYKGFAAKFYTQYINKQKPRYKKFLDTVSIMKQWSIVNEIPLTSFQLEFLISEGLSKTTKFDWQEYFRSIFNTILSMLDGEPIYPIHWEKKYNNDEVIAQKSLKTGILMVDPGNPGNNIASDITEEDVAKIREAVEKSFEAIEKKDWGELFQIPDYEFQAEEY